MKSLNHFVDRISHMSKQWLISTCAVLGIMGSSGLAFAGNNMSSTLWQPTGFLFKQSNFTTYTIMSYGSGLTLKLLEHKWTRSTSTQINALISVHGTVTGVNTSGSAIFALCDSSATPYTNSPTYIVDLPSTVLNQNQNVDFSGIIPISSTAPDVYLCWKTSTSSNGIHIDSANPFTISHIDQN